VRLKKEYQAKRAPTRKKFFAYIEGVPYTVDMQKAFEYAMQQQQA
jgi:hypothetical protein